MELLLAQLRKIWLGLKIHMFILSATCLDKEYKECPSLLHCTEQIWGHPTHITIICD